MSGIEMNRVEIELEGAGVVRVQVLAPHTFRVRMRPDDVFVEPALVRYGVLCSEGPDVAAGVEWGEEQVTIHGETIPVKAHVRQLSGLSAHADRRELAAWLRAVPNVRAVALHHGEERAQRALADFLAQEEA